MVLVTGGESVLCGEAHVPAFARFWEATEKVRERELSHFRYIKVLDWHR